MLHLTSPAKINHFLRVVGKRRDGYHNLQSIIQLLNFSDDVLLKHGSSSKLHIQVTQQEGFATGSVPPSSENLALKAAQTLQQYSGSKQGADIYLHKRIPSGAGLGGGSSNAATVLLGLNKLWQCGLSLAKLAELGQRLGADVPFFIYGKSSWVEGIGELLEPLSSLPTSWYVVVNPGIEIVTGDMFQHPNLMRDKSAIAKESVLAASSFELGNDFEPLLRKEHPYLDKIFRHLQAYGKPMFSGTGSCILLKCVTSIRGEAIIKTLPAAYKAIVAESCNTSPLINLLQYDM